MSNEMLFRLLPFAVFAVMSLVVYVIGAQKIRASERDRCRRICDIAMADMQKEIDRSKGEATNLERRLRQAQLVAQEASRRALARQQETSQLARMNAELWEKLEGPQMDPVEWTKTDVSVPSAPTHDKPVRVEVV